MSDAALMSEGAAPGASRMKWLALGALAVAAIAFAVITAGGLGENLVYYWGPKELRAAGDKAIGATIRLGGQVGKGSIRQLGASSLEFDVVDGQASVRVRTTSIPPQMFREEIGVVVEGTMTKAGYFESKRLMVSHGNEYRAPGDGETVDAKKLMQSTQGLQGAEEKARP
jgi:cytochrome c-type biogenesis protein CcmE